MRILTLLSHSTTLLVLQQIVIAWYLIDFFLARESSTSNKLFKENLSRSSSAQDTIDKIESITTDLKTSLTCDELLKTPTFDKVILTLVDALGSEFIKSSLNHTNVYENKLFKMPFVEESIVQQRTIGFIAKAATPTVTMPRIKAIVSGTIPSFMDIVYNFATNVSNFNGDNLLSSAWSRNRTIVFYGDDTWLSLFGRSMFKRSRETLSFFASDYTSVDTNVTEMAIPETKREPVDWDFMILHYLGLDHIGHNFGTNQSPLIDKKLLEIDSVIREIYNNMASKDLKTLIIICGDHGMSNEGNHGGQSPLESETAMLFMPVNQDIVLTDSYKNKDVHILQIDFAISAALLMGIPIPSMSRGVFIEPLLGSIWKNDDKRLACATLDNLNILVSHLDDGELSHPHGLGIEVLQLLNQSAWASTSRRRHLFIHRGLGTARMIQVYLLRAVASKSDNLIILTVMAGVVLLSLVNMRRACNRLLLPLMSSSERLTCLGAVVFPVLMLNSINYIEMEHAFWPFYSITVFLLFCLVALRTHSVESITRDIDWLRVILFASTLLLTATWNHSVSLGHQDWGWLLPVVSIILMCNFTRQNSELGKRNPFIFFIFGAFILTVKYVEETSEDYHLVALLQVMAVLVLLLASVMNICINSTRDETLVTSIVQKMATSWMWWVFLLSRSRNYIFIISNVIMEASLNSLSNSFFFNPIMRAITYLQFANNAFYGQGNTNLFTSLDIKPAFYGQTRYNIVFSILLLACSAFGAQIYWYMKLFQRVQGGKEQERMSKRPQLSDATNYSKLIPEGTKDAIKDFVDMRNFLTIAYYAFVCMVLRDHVFIWSVVSPKMVYLFMNFLIMRVATAMISSMPRLFTNASELGTRLVGVGYEKIS